MPSNIKEFEDQLKKFGEVYVPSMHTKLVRKLALDVLQRVVLRTPVDTGIARANWMVAVNKVPVGTIEIENLSKEKATNFAMNNGIPVIENCKEYSSISIANNLPYIGVLEFEGHSKQAPDGMVRITLAEIESTFNKK